MHPRHARVTRAARARAERARRMRLSGPQDLIETLDDQRHFFGRDRPETKIAAHSGRDVLIRPTS